MACADTYCFAKLRAPKALQSYLLVSKMCNDVQDPFELSHDLGRTVDRQTSGVLHKEFERAACILADLPQPLDKLMEPYRAGKTE